MVFEISHWAQVRRLANQANDVASIHEQSRKAFANAQAQALALYISTKSSLWYMTGRHGNQYDALLRTHASQLYAATVALTEIMRQFPSEMTDHVEFSNGMRVDEIDFVSPETLLKRLRLENQILRGALHTTYTLGNDTGIDERYLEVWMHEARARAQSLLEATRLP